MPQFLENQEPQTSAADAALLSPLSRRSVLRGAAGAGAAGLAMSTLAGTAMAGPALAASRPDAASRRDAARPAGPEDADLGEAVVVHVRDVRTGELDVYRGTSHVRLTDRDLAARLARASR